MHFTFHICIRFDILIGTETKQLIGLDYVKKLQVQQNQKDSKSWFCECKPSHILSTTPPAASKAVIGDKIKACQQCQHLKASSLTLGSLCIGWVMTGTRRCLDNNATFESGLVKEKNTSAALSPNKSTLIQDESSQSSVINKGCNICHQQLFKLYLQDCIDFMLLLNEYKTDLCCFVDLARGKELSIV